MLLQYVVYYKKFKSQTLKKNFFKLTDCLTKNNHLHLIKHN